MRTDTDYEAMGRTAIAAVDAGQSITSPMLYETDISEGEHLALMRGQSDWRHHGMIRWRFASDYARRDGYCFQVYSSGHLSTEMLRDQPALTMRLIVGDGRRACELEARKAGA